MIIILFLTIRACFCSICCHRFGYFILGFARVFYRLLVFLGANELLILSKILLNLYQRLGYLWQN
jgi:hypothetical protein